MFRSLRLSFPLFCYCFLPLMVKPLTLYYYHECSRKHDFTLNCTIDSYLCQIPSVDIGYFGESWSTHWWNSCALCPPEYHINWTPQSRPLCCICKIISTRLSCNFPGCLATNLLLSWLCHWTQSIWYNKFTINY